MPYFKTTHNILVDSNYDELWSQEWMNYNHLTLPPSEKWDYKRELKIEDVDIWEVLYEAGGGFGVYAAWQPYAEFYMIVPDWQMIQNGIGIETFYGKNSQNVLKQRLNKYKIPYQNNKIWIDPKDMWLYTD
jgi:hypothetical protein